MQVSQYFIFFPVIMPVPGLAAKSTFLERLGLAASIPILWEPR
jgi:hypothetical protein